jgi:hypothetical protein
METRESHESDSDSAPSESTPGAPERLLSEDLAVPQVVECQEVPRFSSGFYIESIYLAGHLLTPL